MNLLSEGAKQRESEEKDGGGCISRSKREPVFDSSDKVLR